AMKAADQHHKAESLGQSDLFGLLASESDEVEQAFVKTTPLTDNQWLDGEKDTLGLYLTGHPINQYRKELRYYTSCKLVDLQPTNRDVQSTAAGLVISARTLINKKGNRWGLVTLDDKSARIDVRLFPEQFEMYQDMLQVNNILVISGQVSFDNFSGGITMTARDICTIAQAREKRIKALKVTLNMVQVEASFFENLQRVLEPYKFGTCPIKVFYQRPDALAELTLGTEWCVTPTDDLIHKLSLMAAQDVELEFN
ncbi:MAG: OB-fold nucleic acid binding domain-containing protein, partial [Pseudoalteromonas sp.]